jgi:hypothetical protein
MAIIASIPATHTVLSGYDCATSDRTNDSFESLIVKCEHK